MTQHNESNGHLQSEHNNSGPSNITLDTSSQENTSSNILNKLPDKTEALGGVSSNKELLSPDSQLLQSQSAKNDQPVSDTGNFSVVSLVENSGSSNSPKSQAEQSLPDEQETRDATSSEASEKGKTNEKIDKNVAETSSSQILPSESEGTPSAESAQISTSSNEQHPKSPEQKGSSNANGAVPKHKPGKARSRNRHKR